MKFKARIKDMAFTVDGSFTVTLKVEEPSIDRDRDSVRINEFSKLSEEKLDVELKKHKEKRSLNANAYYWHLVGEIRKVTGDSNNKIHNIMLNRYGELDRLPDGSLIPFCILDSIDYMGFSYPHLKATQRTLSKAGKLYRWYYQIKGSSEYNTAEMAFLIEGIVGECREMGIETLSPDELERMMALYEKRQGAEKT